MGEVSPSGVAVVLFKRHGGASWPFGGAVEGLSRPSRRTAGLLVVEGGASGFAANTGHIHRTPAVNACICGESLA